MTIWHGFLLLVNVALLVCYLISCSKGYLKKGKTGGINFVFVCQT